MELVDQDAEEGDVGLRIVRHSSGQSFRTEVFANLLYPVLPCSMAKCLSRLDKGLAESASCIQDRLNRLIHD